MQYLTIILLSVGLLTLSQSLSAQVSSQSRSMSEGTYEALVLDLPGHDAKDIGKLWIDFVKDNYRAKTKYDRKLKLYVTPEVDIPSIGRGRLLNLYADASDRGKSASLAVWYQLGPNEYLGPNSHPESYREAERMLLEFNQLAMRERTKDELSVEEDKLKDLTKELERLQRDKEKYERDIEKAEAEIRQAKENISQNERDQQAKQAEIEAQQQAVERVDKKLKKMD